jgi:hypothetical protein
MDRIRELLARVTELSDDELSELRNLIVSELDGENSVDDIELAQLEELADAGVLVRDETTRREADKTKRAELKAKVAEFKSANEPQAGEDPAAGSEPAPGGAEQSDAQKDGQGSAPADQSKGDVNVSVTAGGEMQVPEGREPQQRQKSGTTVITAAADIPGYGMGQVIGNDTDLAKALTNRIHTLRGSRGGDGELVRVATAELQVPEDQTLQLSDSEGNLAKVLAFTHPAAMTAAGGIQAFRETRYDLFDLVGVTDRPVRDALPVFRTERGGVRFMRPPSLADVNGVVGIWTNQNDIDALTNPAVRKPSFRVAPGPEVVVDTQAITMIMTFGNLVTRAYPELVRRHQQLALVAQARVAEQQLLTQIGALSTAVTGRTQQVSAVRELLLAVYQGTAAYRNRHRMGPNTPLRAIMPAWFKNLLMADVMLSGDELGDAMAIADATVQGWFRNLNLNITWSLDGEAGQDYSGLTAAGTGAGGSVGFAAFPANMIWYLFAEGTFAFMDGGTLDLGLVRDSTLNAANDYQMFVESWENVVKFGLESYRVTTPILPTGRSVPRG